MRRSGRQVVRFAALLAAGLACASSAAAQSPFKRLGKLKEAVRKTVDSTVTGAAATAIDSSALAKPLAPVAAFVDRRDRCAADSLSVGRTLVTAVRQELAPGDSAPARSTECPSQPAATGAPVAATPFSSSPGDQPPSTAASAVGAAIVAAPVVAAGAKGLLAGGRRNASDWLRELLERGRIRLDGLAFLPGSDRMEPVVADWIEPVAEALAALEGARVGIHVCREANPRAADDEALVRRRMERVWATLLSVGAPDRAFEPLAQTPLDLVVEQHPAKLGKAAVELVLRQGGQP